MGGPRAAALEGCAQELLVGRAVDILARTFDAEPSAVAKLLAGAYRHDWSRDVFARGAYSYPLVGGADAGRALGEPLEGTLYFAGEATSEPPHNGTVEGALDSGFRVAREILEK